MLRPRCNVPYPTLFHHFIDLLTPNGNARIRVDDITAVESYEGPNREGETIYSCKIYTVSGHRCVVQHTYSQVLNVLDDFYEVEELREGVPVLAAGPAGLEPSHSGR